MKWIRNMFCKHSFLLHDIGWRNDTDISGYNFEVLKCEKCGKLVHGKIVRRKT